MNIRPVIIAALFALVPLCASAQRVALSTNATDYLVLGTFNARVDVAVSRRLTVGATLKYNPWTFHKGDPDRQLQYRQFKAAVNFRVYPWNIYSGWWVEAGPQYQQYNCGGIIAPKTEEGDAFGAKFGFGYSYMLSQHINIDFGLCGWTGVSVFTQYDKPGHGAIVGKGVKGFILPNDILVAITYIF